MIAKNGPNYVIVNYPAEDDEMSFSAADRGRVVARAPCRSLNEPSYMHSFSITKSYFVLVEQPLCVRLNSVIWSMLTGRPIVKALKWRPKLAVIFFFMFGLFKKKIIYHLFNFRLDFG